MTNYFDTPYDSSDSSPRSSGSFDEPRKVMLLCLYKKKLKKVDVDSYIGLMKELFAHLGIAPSVSIMYQLPGKKEKRSVTDDNDLRLMMQEYVHHYCDLATRPDQEYMMLFLDPSKSLFSSMLSSFKKAFVPGAKILIVNMTRVQLKFVICHADAPSQHTVVETLEPYSPLEAYKN